MSCHVKRKQRGIRDDHQTPKPPVTCYVTRGSFDKEWHVWNTSAMALVLQKGDSMCACLVASDFEDTTAVCILVLQGFTISGMGSKTCVTDRVISFQQPIGDLQSVADQVDLDAVCMSKGIKCAIFLEHYTNNPCDEELQLGRRVHSLFVQTVGEMLKRKYDIMHHYPLFIRALGLHYADADSPDPPELKDVMVTGGLLDRSVKDHQSLHGVPLVGTDHTFFSQWNYPDNREEDQEQEGADELLLNYHQETQETHSDDPSS